MPVRGGQPGRQIEGIGHERAGRLEVGLVSRGFGEPAEHFGRVAEGGDGLERQRLLSCGKPGVRADGLRDLRAGERVAGDLDAVPFDRGSAEQDRGGGPADVAYRDHL